MIHRTLACACLLTTFAWKAFCVAAVATDNEPPVPSRSALNGDGPRVVVSTDVGGADPNHSEYVISPEMFTPRAFAMSLSRVRLAEE